VREGETTTNVLLVTERSNGRKRIVFVRPLDKRKRKKRPPDRGLSLGDNPTSSGENREGHLLRKRGKGKKRKKTQIFLFTVRRPRGGKGKRRVKLHPREGKGGELLFRGGRKEKKTRTAYFRTGPKGEDVPNTNRLTGEGGEGEGGR